MVGTICHISFSSLLTTFVSLFTNMRPIMLIDINYQGPVATAVHRCSAIILYVLKISKLRERKKIVYGYINVLVNVW